MMDFLHSVIDGIEKSLSHTEITEYTKKIPTVYYRSFFVPLWFRVKNLSFFEAVLKAVDF